MGTVGRGEDMRQVISREVAITSEQEKKYIASGGVVCPFCGGEDIGGGFVNIEAGTAWQHVTCGECDRAWTDVYKLDRVEVQS